MIFGVAATVLFVLAVLFVPAINHHDWAVLASFTAYIGAFMLVSADNGLKVLVMSLGVALAIVVGGLFADLSFVEELIDRMYGRAIGNEPGAKIDYESQSITRYEVRRDAVLLLAGLLTLTIAVWRSWTSDTQARASQAHMLSDRFQAAAIELSKPSLLARLGGLHELDSLAKEDPRRYHVEVMRQLTAFVRNPPQDDDLISGDEVARQDVIEAAQLIGANRKVALEKAASFTISLDGAYLRGASFSRVDFSGTLMRKVDLRDAFLESAVFSHSHLEDGRLCRAFMVNADLTDARLERAKLRGTNLSSAVLVDAHLFGAVLSSPDGYETDPSNSTILSEAELARADFTAAKLRGVLMWGADFEYTRLLQTDLSGADLSSHKGLTVKGLTKEQLEQAVWDGLSEPALRDTVDAKTGEQLLWQGRIQPTPQQGQST